MASILSIVTASPFRALTTRATVQADLGLVVPSPDDAWIDAEISAASTAIEGYCSRVFARETLREQWRDISLEKLILARAPVVSITSVVEDGVTLASTDYELDAATGFLWRLSGDARTHWRAQKVVVTYLAGYLLPGQSGRDLPADIERACRLAVVSAFQQRGRDVMIRSESDTAIGSISYLDPRGGMEALPPQVAGLLGPYRMLSA